jgi:hypothetical protein
MDQKVYENLKKSKLAQDIATEFEIPLDRAVRRILIALNNSDFTDSILDQLIGYLNKIEDLIVTDGKIEIVNMDK